AVVGHRTHPVLWRHAGIVPRQEGNRDSDPGLRLDDQRHVHPHRAPAEPRTGGAFREAGPETFLPRLVHPAVAVFGYVRHHPVVGAALFQDARYLHPGRLSSDRAAILRLTPN